MVGMAEIDKMSGEEFEDKVRVLFEDLGYMVEGTPRSGDWGADLIVSKGGARTAVQVKCYRGSVDQKAVREAIGSKPKYGCSESMVVINRKFTKGAIELARVNKYFSGTVMLLLRCFKRRLNYVLKNNKKEHFCSKNLNYMEI